MSDRPGRPVRPALLATAKTNALSLHEASERLGVHYMTAYRYVRTGRLAATKHEGVWQIDPHDLEQLHITAPAAPPGRGNRSHASRVPDLVDRLLAGDEGGAWALTQTVLGGGTSPADLYLELFVPALRLVGERWASGAITVADEHAATVVMQRLLGRLGPLFLRPGRTRGIVILGATEGDLHSLPTALAADLLRGHGFVVIDLGANVPTPSFVDCVRRMPRVLAVGITVTTPQCRDHARTLVAELRRAGVTVPIILGGSAVGEADARLFGADEWADGAPRLIQLLQDRS